MIRQMTSAQLLRLFVGVCVLLGLSACQSAFRKIPNDQADRSVMSSVEIQEILAIQAKKPLSRKTRNVAFHCTGLYNCDIASIDRLPVINHRSGKPYRSAVRRNLLYIDKKKSGDINYVGLMSSGSHLVNIRFYPISEGAFENFAVEHDFKKDKIYRFHGYRKPVDKLTNEEDVSLLALASPRPMCIALYEGRKAIRQFCKEADIITGVGQFVEEPVSTRPSLLDGFQDNFFHRFSDG